MDNSQQEPDEIDAIIKRLDAKKEAETLSQQKSSPDGVTIDPKVADIAKKYYQKINPEDDPYGAKAAGLGLTNSSLFGLGKKYNALQEALIPDAARTLATVFPGSRGDGTIIDHATGMPDDTTFGQRYQGALNGINDVETRLNQDSPWIYGGAGFANPTNWLAGGLLGKGLGAAAQASAKLPVIGNTLGKLGTGIGTVLDKIESAPYIGQIARGGIEEATGGVTAAPFVTPLSADSRQTDNPGEVPSFSQAVKTLGQKSLEQVTNPKNILMNALMGGGLGAGFGAARSIGEYGSTRPLDSKYEALAGNLSQGSVDQLQAMQDAQPNTSLVPKLQANPTTKQALKEVAADLPDEVRQVLAKYGLSQADVGLDQANRLAEISTRGKNEKQIGETLQNLSDTQRDVELNPLYKKTAQLFDQYEKRPSPVLNPDGTINYEKYAELQRILRGADREYLPEVQDTLRNKHVQNVLEKNPELNTSSALIEKGLPDITGKKKETQPDYEPSPYYDEYSANVPNKNRNPENYPGFYGDFIKNRQQEFLQLPQKYENIAKPTDPLIANDYHNPLSDILSKSPKVDDPFNLNYDGIIHPETNYILGEIKALADYKYGKDQSSTRLRSLINDLGDFRNANGALDANDAFQYAKEKTDDLHNNNVLGRYVSKWTQPPVRNNPFAYEPETIASYKENQPIHLPEKLFNENPIEADEFLKRIAPAALKQNEKQIGKQVAGSQLQKVLNEGIDPEKINSFIRNKKTQLERFGLNKDDINDISDILNDSLVLKKTSEVTPSYSGIDDETHIPATKAGILSKIMHKLFFSETAQEKIAKNPDAQMALIHAIADPKNANQTIAEIRKLVMQADKNKQTKVNMEKFFAQIRQNAINAILQQQANKKDEQ
jgi:hypothetical protein